MSIDPNNLAGTASLTFDDEFNTLSLWNGSSGTWMTTYPFSSDTGNGGTLSSNGEQEWYINSRYAPTASITPWTVSNGVLSLTAAPAPASLQSQINNYQYTSGLIDTYHSFSQTYGYFEMRAELPAGQGFWPSFWLIPADGSWPPEIDAMEVLGRDPTTLYTTIHTGTASNEINAGSSATVANTSTGFHTYGVDWEPDYVTWYFDGQQVFKTPTPSDLDKPMYMIANLALGGSWAGNVDSTTPFPASMKIDYIRAYQTAPAQSGPGLFTLPTSAPWTHVINKVTGGQMVGTSGPDKLDGNGAATQMNGAGGDDTFVVYHAADVVADTGTSVTTVQSLAPSFTLPGGIDNLVLKGTTSQVAIGNAGDNILTSNNAGSTLKGGGGNDILIAGGGADTLTGGSGDNIFQFNRIPSHAGQVTDFDPARDILDLRKLFSGTGYQGTNPVADGYVKFADDGHGNTQVLFNAHVGRGATFHLITTLDGIQPGQMHAQGDWYFH